MMPIRMRGNCRLHCEHDKLPPPWRGPSSEARRCEVALSLRVLSAADLDCSHSLRHGTGWVARDLGERRFLTFRTLVAARLATAEAETMLPGKKNKWRLIVQLANCQSKTFSSWDCLTFQEIACYFVTKAEYSFRNKWKRIILCTWTKKKLASGTSGDIILKVHHHLISM